MTNTTTTTTTTTPVTVDPTDLITVAMIAKRRNLTAPAVLAAAKSETFPKPVDVPNMGERKRIYLWSEVEAWYNARDSKRADRAAEREAERLAKIAKTEERLAALKAKAEAPAEPKKPGRKPKAKAPASK